MLFDEDLKKAINNCVSGYFLEKILFHYELCLFSVPVCMDMSWNISDMLLSSEAPLYWLPLTRRESNQASGRGATSHQSFTNIPNTRAGRPIRRFLLTYFIKQQETRISVPFPSCPAQGCHPHHQLSCFSSCGVSGRGADGLLTSIGLREAPLLGCWIMHVPLEEQGDARAAVL